MACGGTGARESCQRYDDGVWKQTALAHSRHYHSSWTKDGVVYLIGGWSKDALWESESITEDGVSKGYQFRTKKRTQ